MRHGKRNLYSILFSHSYPLATELMQVTGSWKEFHQNNNFLRGCKWYVGLTVHSLPDVTSCSLMLLDCHSTSLMQSHVLISDVQPCLQAPPIKSGKGPSVTCKHSRMCCVSSLHLEQRNHVRPLPITKFLTRESGRVVPRPFENGYKATILFINPPISETQSVVTLARLLYYSCLTRFAYSHSVARSVHLLSSTVSGYHVVT